MSVWDYVRNHSKSIHSSETLQVSGHPILGQRDWFPPILCSDAQPGAPGCRHRPQGTAGYRRVVASTPCPQHSTAPGDFYKHTAPEQGSQFGATFLMQMLLGSTWYYKICHSRFAPWFCADDFAPRFELHFARRLTGTQILDPFGTTGWPWPRWQVCFGRHEKSHGHGSWLWRWSELEWPLAIETDQWWLVMVYPPVCYLVHDVSWWIWWSWLFIIYTYLYYITLHVPGDSWCDSWGIMNDEWWIMMNHDEFFGVWWWL